MEVQAIMSKRLAALPPEATTAEAAKLMKEEDVGAIVALGPGEKPLGILTDRDLVLRVVALKRDPSQVKLQEVMSKHPCTVPGNEPVMLAARRMAEKGVRRLLVVDEGGSVIGVVSVDDLLTILISELSNVCTVMVGSSRLVR
jgi:CBS domain-containing protein